MELSYEPQSPAVYKGLENLQWTRFECHGMKETQALPVSLPSPSHAHRHSSAACLEKSSSFPLKKQLEKQSGKKSLTSTPAAIFSHQKKKEREKWENSSVGRSTGCCFPKTTLIHQLYFPDWCAVKATISCCFQSFQLGLLSVSGQKKAAISMNSWNTSLLTWLLNTTHHHTSQLILKYPLPPPCFLASYTPACSPDIISFHISCPQTPWGWFKPYNETKYQRRSLNIEMILWFSGCCVTNSFCALSAWWLSAFTAAFLQFVKGSIIYSAKAEGYGATILPKEVLIGTQGTHGAAHALANSLWRRWASIWRLIGKVNALQLPDIQKRNPVFPGLFSNACILITARDFFSPSGAICKSPSLRFITQSEMLVVHRN